MRGIFGIIPLIMIIGIGISVLIPFVTDLSQQMNESEEYSEIMSIIPIDGMPLFILGIAIVVFIFLFSIFVGVGGGCSDEYDSSGDDEEEDDDEEADDDIEEDGDEPSENISIKDKLRMSKQKLKPKSDPTKDKSDDESFDYDAVLDDDNILDL